MFYDNIESLPKYVKNYSPKIQRQWIHVFNNTFKKVGEARAIQAGNSVLKKRFVKRNSMEKNTHEDFFIHTIDRWLGNLNG